VRASIFDIAKSPTGFGSLASGALIGAMSGIDHDLVVPTASALAFGKPEPLLACSHVQYFAQPQVKHAIAAIVPAPPGSHSLLWRVSGSSRTFDRLQARIWH
jgi:hypothetical protein